MALKFTKYNSIAIVLFFVLSTTFFAWQATNFRVDASADTLLMKGNEHYITSQEANQTFQTSEFILVAFKPENGDIFSKNTLQTLQEISSKVNEIERVSGTRSVVNIPIFTELDSINSEISPESLSWSEKKFSPDTLELALSSHPLYEGLFFNEEMSAVSIQISFQGNDKLDHLSKEILSLQKQQLESNLTDEQSSSLKRLKEERDTINRRLDKSRSDEITQIRDIVNSYSDRGEFFLGGGNLLTHQLIKIIKNDLLIFGSLISAIICVLLFFLFRQFRWVILPALCCTVSVITTIGLLGFFDLKVTVISTNVIALQIILTLAIVVHLIVQYNEFRSSDDSATHSELINRTIREKAKPCFYAGITTSVGFGSLIFSGVAPVISFGWMMVIAMTVTIIVSLLLFPAFTLLLSHTKNLSPTPTWVRKIMLSFTKSCRSYPLVIIICSVFLMGVGVTGCLRLTAENSFLNYFDRSTDVYRELSYIDKEFGGSTPLDILYTVPDEITDPNLIVSADAISQVQKIHELLQSEKAIGNVTSVADFATVAKVTTGKPLTEYEITALYRTLDDDLKRTLFGSFYDVDKKQARISTRVKDTTTDLDRSVLVNNIQSGITNLGIEESKFVLTNLFILYQDILSRLVDSQITTLVIVYIAMAVILLLIFRSIRISIICLIPNIVTTAVIMGAMGWASIPLDLMTITIAAVAMGISVDDTIHYTHRFQKEVAAGVENPLKSAHLSVGYALLYTTLIIVIGFSSLLLSDFVPSVLFGLLTSGAMFIALLTDATLLPVLLKWNSRKS